MNGIITNFLTYAFGYLRFQKQLSYYKIAKLSGLRVETISKLASFPASGSVTSCDAFISWFCSSFNIQAKAIMKKCITVNTKKK